MYYNSSYYSKQLYDVKEIILGQNNCRWNMITMKLSIIILGFRK